MSLELGKGAEHMENQTAATRTRVDLFLQAHQTNAGLFKLFGQQDQIMQCASKAVEPPDDDYIAGSSHFEQQRQARSRGLRPAQSIFEELFAASRAKSISLQIEILIVRRNACVAEQHFCQKTRESLMFQDVE